MDIFSSVLATRPPNFTTFNASGYVENGLSPSLNSPVTTAPIGFLNAGFTHGAVSNVIFSNGRYVYPKQNTSFEFLVKNSNVATGSSDVVFSSGPSGQINVSRLSYNGGTRYRFLVTSPSGTAEANLYSTLIPSLDYVVFTVNDESLDLYVNGMTTSIAKPLDLEAFNSITAWATTSKMVYYAVVRDYPMPREYHDDIYRQVLSTFAPQAVEGFYNATTFVMDHEFLLEKEEFELTDVSSAIYTAEPSDSFVLMPTPSEDGSFDVTLGATRYTGVDVPVLGTFDANTAPDEGLTALPGSTVRLLGSAATLPAANMPDRLATVAPSSLFSWSGAMPSVYGSVTIAPDASATVAAEYPTAYSMWVFLSNTSPGTIISGGAISLSASAGAITRAGMSQIYVDGVAGATTITAGWHNISFIPTTQQNAALVLSSSSVALASFAMLYAASPSSYLVAMYNSYINTPKVTANETGAIAITEGTPVVYNHKWSIKSVD